MQVSKPAGGLSFDPIQRVVWRDGIRIPLTPKAAAILSYLMERPGRVVPNAQLLKAIWPDAFIQPEGIKVYIFELRRALGDNAKQPIHIQSISRRGYRLVGPLAHLDARKSPTEVIENVDLPGRKNELQVLNGCLDEARNGVMQIVFLDGEFGVGKTALVETFADGAPPDVHVLTGRCYLTEGGRKPYYSVLEALGSCRVPSFQRFLALHSPTWALQMPARFSPEELAVLRSETLNMTPAAMLRELCELIEAISQTNVLLFILEDVHWADSATLDFVNTIARRRHAEKLFLICTSLPAGSLSTGHSHGTIDRELFVKSLCRRIELTPLIPAPRLTGGTPV